MTMGGTEHFQVMTTSVEYSYSCMIIADIPPAAGSVPPRYHDDGRGVEEAKQEGPGTFFRCLNLAWARRFCSVLRGLALVPEPPEGTLSMAAMSSLAPQSSILIAALLIEDSMPRC